MTERNLKSALAMSILICLGLAASLGYELIHRRNTPALPADASPVVARGPEAGTESSGPKPASADSDEPALAPIQLSPQRAQEIGVAMATVQMKDVSDELHVPGNVAIDERRLSYVQTRFPGWIKSVFVNATYQYVRQGQKLFTIYSPDLVSTEQEYLLARKNQHTVTEHMHGTAAEEGNWLVEAAAERLRRFNIPEAEIAHLESSGTANREISIESPASGYVTERNALPNEFVQPETKLYTIADLSTVWVYANVAQTDVGRLKPGDRAQVQVDAYPGRKFSGRVDQILPDVDVATRTVRVRLVMSNAGVALKPGMYVDVDIEAPLGRQLVIPASGVLQAGAHQIAFIDRGQGSLEPREIETGPRFGDSIAVLKGLNASDRIVSSANFLVDSEAQLQGAVDGLTPSPQAGNPATPASQQMNIDFATAPSPPHKGANTVRVKLTGTDGKPVAGTQVSVVFIMPAMPAMAMAAEHASATLAERSAGTFDGPLQLPSGGTWQVTITVQRAGKTIATKQLSVSAEGGM